MFTVLSRLCIKDRENIQNQDVRRAYGMLSGILGICLNILLFSFKYTAGHISGSIAITADAFNNLSDAGSSLITFCGFRLSGKKPDAGHPFGHGRIEYFSALAVSMLIILMGVELMKTSIGKIIAPEPMDTSVVSVIILLASIGVKLYMFVYNRRYGRMLDSAAMRATAVDSVSDAIATSCVLLSVLVWLVFEVNIDAWCGILVALSIIYAGLSTARETLDTLLGAAPSPELVKQIEEIVTSHEIILGMHDLIIHDYGPGRRIISLHGEVPGNGDILEMHEVIDHIERELNEKLGCEAVIHMDPIEQNNTVASQTFAQVTEIVKTIDENLMTHDFRMVPGPNRTNLIFDVVIPHKFSIKEDALEKEIDKRVHEKWPEYSCVIKFDNSYI